MSQQQSDRLFDEVFAHLYRPEAVYEHHWTAGDLIVWDNLALQHGRRANPNSVRRSLRRVVLNDVSNDDGSRHRFPSGPLAGPQEEGR
jgi:taurine dioxygenase